MNIVNNNTLIIFNIMGMFSWIGKKVEKKYKFYTIRDKYKTYDELHKDLKKSGLESSQLIFGIDYTKSNRWNGEKTFKNQCLHEISSGAKNPYQNAIEVACRMLEPFDDDNQIPVFGFGDSRTTDKAVFPFFPDGRSCNGIREVLSRYNEITPSIKLSGPTNFAPIIYASIELVKRTCQYHILVIIADGQVTNRDETQQAIIDASDYPISIIVIGVGDGPWEEMKKYDDSLPTRKFDNFQFVCFSDVMKRKNVENYDLELAREMMMEIPEQYSAIKKLNLINKCKAESNGVGMIACSEDVVHPPEYKDV